MIAKSPISDALPLEVARPASHARLWSRGRLRRPIKRSSVANFNAAGQSTALSYCKLSPISPPLFQGRESDQLPFGDKWTEQHQIWDDTEQSSVNPKNVLNFPYVDLSHNRSMSKATGVETQAKFWIFFHPVKLRARWAKCLEYLSSSNLEPTSDVRRGLGGWTIALLKSTAIKHKTCQQLWQSSGTDTNTNRMNRHSSIVSTHVNSIRFTINTLTRSLHSQSHNIQPSSQTIAAFFTSTAPGPGRCLIW